MTLVDFIGKTPLLRLSRVLPKWLSPDVEVYAKAEWFNPGGSVKDRPAYRMIQDGMASGDFKPGQTLIDSTSGNTGIAYAMLGAAMDFSVELVMPKNVSRERKRIVEAYGAKIIYSDPLKGSDGARDLVSEIVSKNPGRYFFPDQYSNPSNWRAHYETTGPEIWRDTEGRITHFAAGMGTSGTMMGTSRYLKEKNSEIQTIAVQPESFHGIEGLKNMESSFPVKIYNPKFHDVKITIPTEPAYAWTKELASEEGFLVGPSSGAVLYGTLEAIKDLKEGVVVVIFPDGGDKYLSTQLWEP
jgi:cysteine synthase B